MYLPITENKCLNSLLSSTRCHFCENHHHSSLCILFLDLYQGQFLILMHPIPVSAAHLGTRGLDDLYTFGIYTRSSHPILVSTQPDQKLLSSKMMASHCRNQISQMRKIVLFHNLHMRMYPAPFCSWEEMSKPAPWNRVLAQQETRDSKFQQFCIDDDCRSDDRNDAIKPEQRLPSTPT